MGVKSRSQTQILCFLCWLCAYYKDNVKLQWKACADLLDIFIQLLIWINLSHKVLQLLLTEHLQGTECNISIKDGAEVDGKHCWKCCWLLQIPKWQQRGSKTQTEIVEGKVSLMRSACAASVRVTRIPLSTKWPPSSSYQLLCSHSMIKNLCFELLELTWDPSGLLLLAGPGTGITRAFPTVVVLLAILVATGWAEGLWSYPVSKRVKLRSENQAERWGGGLSPSQGPGPEIWKKYWVTYRLCYV